ncbi:hypothetical protein SAMN05421881_100289 [Nitrosomonas halophila]|uniref:Uncharacterized protein n=1 Tax=Nitrosomonas halophila TaxID=44576 RepID=A0A1H3C7D8_9PROT|nr:hypothetical protein SAMN05421881_100289 [Nitrosomonas halophila]
MKFLVYPFDCQPDSTEDIRSADCGGKTRIRRQSIVVEKTNACHLKKLKRLLHKPVAGNKNDETRPNKRNCLKMQDALARPIQSHET